MSSPPRRCGVPARSACSQASRSPKVWIGCARGVRKKAKGERRKAKGSPPSLLLSLSDLGLLPSRNDTAHPRAEAQRWAAVLADGAGEAGGGGSPRRRGGLMGPAASHSPTGAGNASGRWWVGRTRVAWLQGAAHDPDAQKRMEHSTCRVLAAVDRAVARCRVLSVLKPRQSREEITQQTRVSKLRGPPSPPGRGHSQLSFLALQLRVSLTSSTDFPQSLHPGPPGLASRC